MVILASQWARPYMASTRLEMAATAAPFLIAVLYVLALLQAVSAPAVAPSAGMGVDTASSGASEARPPPPRRVVDISALPYDLPVTGRADHIVAAKQTVLEQLRSLGMQSHFPPLATLAGFLIPANPEELLLYRPDAIFASSDWQDSLRVLGFPRLLDLNYDPRSTVETKIATWEQLGRVMGAEARAETISAAFLSERRRLLRSLQAEVRVEVVILAGGPGWWNIAGDGYYLNTVAAIVKGHNSASSYLNDPRVDLEQLAILDPPVILLNGQPGDDAVPRDLYADPHWQILRAVRDRRVYKMPRFTGFLGPVEETLFLQWLAEVLHPALPPRLRIEFRSTYETGYGYSPSDAEIDRVINLAANTSSAGYRRFTSNDSNIHE